MTNNLPGSTQEKTLRCTECEDCQQSRVTTEKPHDCPRTVLSLQGQRRPFPSPGQEGRLCFPVQLMGGRGCLL